MIHGLGAPPGPPRVIRAARAQARIAAFAANLAPADMAVELHFDHGTLVALGVPEGDAQLGQLLTISVLADTCQHNHITILGPSRLVLHKFHACLAVNRRLCAGNAGNRCKSTGDRRRSTRANRFVFFMSWLTQLGVHIDQAWHHQSIRRVNDLSISVRLDIVCDDATFVEQHIGNSVHSLRWIDHAPITNQ